MKIDNFVKNDYDFLILLLLLLLNFNKFLFAHFLSVRDNVSSLFKIKWTREKNIQYDETFKAAFS